MCVDKPGCQCHWANLGPDCSRLRVPSTPARYVVLGPPPTPLTRANNVNTSSRSPASTRKRKAGPNGTYKTPAKHPNTSLSAPVFGVGPSLTPVHEQVHIADDNDGEPPMGKAFPSLTKERHAASTNRHDIWGFMRPIDESSVAKYSNPASVLETFPRLMARPKADYVGCLLCE
jgi:hypothetical protein